MIVSTAPGRCGIVGNPTDMYGGSVLSITTRERARCEIADCDALTISSGGQTAVIRHHEDLAIRRDMLDICRAALSHFGIDPAIHRFSLSLSTDVPMRAGMAGSTALVVAAVGALDRYLGLRMDPWTMAETARRIEAGIMGVLCGFQDQHMGVFGGINFMDFAHKQELKQGDDEPLATIEALKAFVGPIPLIAAHTGIAHDSGVVHRSPRERWLAGETEVREGYSRIAYLARLAKRALLARDWQALGALMNENHEIVAKFGGSGPPNERLIAAARAAGAYGAKLAGAGGGGTILALVPDMEAAKRALMQAGAESLLFPEPGPGLQVTVESGIEPRALNGKAGHAVAEGSAHRTPSPV